MSQNELTDLFHEVLNGSPHSTHFAGFRDRIERALELGSSSVVDARAAVTRELDDLDRWRSVVGELLRGIERLEGRRAHSARFTDHWTAARRDEIHRVRVSDPDTALRLLATAIAEGLAADRVAPLATLMGPRSRWPRVHRARLAILSRALKDHGRMWHSMIPAIDILLEKARDLSASDAAHLWVLKGRIHLYDTDDRALAVACLTRAHDLARDDGVVAAAFGEFELLFGSPEEAAAYFQTSITATPQVVDGFVGLGRYFVRTDRRFDANAWFDRAIAFVRANPDPLGALGRLRAKVPPALRLRLAREMKRTDAATALQILEATAGARDDDDDTLTQPRIDLFRALLHQELQQPTEAARAYEQVGRSSIDAQNYPRATLAFGRAARLAPDEPGLRWRLADTLFMRSFLPRFPWSDAGLLRRSIELWDRQFAQAPPVAPYGWAYVTRAAAEERAAALDGDKPAILWRTVIWAEQAIASIPLHATAWAILARAHRKLHNVEVSLATSARALELVPNSPPLLEERIIQVVNKDRSPAAYPLLDALERAQARDTGWIGAIRAYLDLYERGSIAPSATALVARDAFDAAIAAQGGVPWLLADRARASFRAGYHAAWRRDLATLWGLRDAVEPDERIRCVQAGLFVAPPDEVLSRLSALLPDSGEDLPRVQFAIAIAHAKRGAIDEGIRWLRSYLANPALKARDLHDVAEFDGPELEADRADWATPEAGKAILDELASAARCRPPDPEPADALDELERRTSVWDLDEARLGVALTRARLRREAGLLQDAYLDYRSLEGDPRVPLAGAAAHAAIVAWLREADDVAASFDATSSLRRYEAIAECAGTNSLPEVHARRAMMLVRTGAISHARAAMQLALHHRRRSGGGNPGRWLAGECEGFLAGPDTFWAVDGLWRGWAAESDDPDERVALSIAHEAWRELLVRRVGLAADAASTRSAITAVHPVGVELGRGLTGDDLGEESLLGAMKAMRARLEADAGVQLPGTPFRNNAELDDLADGYVVMTDEMPRAFHRIPSGGRFVPIAANVLHTMGINRATPAVAPSDGSWIPREDVELVESLGLTAEPPGVGIAYHVEHVVRDRLARFVGPDEVARIIKVWSGDEDHARAIGEVASSADDMLRLGRVLRSVVDEGLSVRDGHLILDALLEAEPSRRMVPRVAVERVRRRLGPALPGIGTDWKHVPVPPRIETAIAAAIVCNEQEPFLAMPPAEVQEILSELRALLSGHEKVALVTQDPIARFYLRRLVRLEHRYTPLLCVAELRSDP